MIRSKTIIGREKEKDLLERVYASGKSEFVALYGRRRIGKTFLVREMFKDEFVFYASGILEGDAGSQLDSFNRALKDYGHDGDVCHTWMDAFAGLKDILTKCNNRNRSVVFIDELPCFDTYDSKFLPALDWFWNTFGSARSDVMFIVCGSSTSWMLNNLLNNKKGLYNRLTRIIHLRPFKLREVELFARANRSYWERIDVLKMYCVLGGVPLYWSLIDYAKSVEENIDLMFFAESPIFEGLSKQKLNPNQMDGFPFYTNKSPSIKFGFHRLIELCI